MQLKNILIVALLLLFTVPAQAGKSTLLPDRLFMDPIAYPRSPQSSFMGATSFYDDERILYLDVVIGKDLDIYSYRFYDLPIDIHLFAAGSAWATLGVEENMSFPLLLQDFLAQGGVKFTIENTFGSIRFNHISSHLGDGMDKVLEKQMTKKQRKKYEAYQEIADELDLRLTLQKPFVYSRDFMSGLIGQNHTVGILIARSYIHGGYAHKIYPSTVGKYFVGFGNELEAPIIPAPYYAHDITWNDDTRSLDYSGQLGVHLMRNQSNDVRFAITFYRGSDRRGQMLGRHLEQISAGVVVQ